MSSALEVQPLPEVTGYSTDERLYATRYKQGGRTVYQIALSPLELTGLVTRPNPDKTLDDNRKIRPRHAVEFAKYILDNESWVIPGIILRAPSTIFTFTADRDVHTAQFGVLSYGKASGGQIQILDGQHRILGFHVALEMLNDQLQKATDHLRRAERTEDKGSRGVRDARAAVEEIKRKIDNLANERVSVEIQVTNNPKEYRQMFYDIAENAIGITAAVKARFDQRKVINRALPLVAEHPLLNDRLDDNIDRVSTNSPYLLSVKHVAETARAANVGFEGRIGKVMEKQLQEAEVAKKGLDFFDDLVGGFPQFSLIMSGQLLPSTLRQTTILGSSGFLRVLAGVHHELLNNHGFERQMVVEFFKKLAPHVGAPIHENTIWRRQMPEIFDLGAYGPRGRRQDSVLLLNTLVAWAIDKPAFLDAVPEPAPVVEADEDEGIDFALGHDLKPLEVEIRNEVEDIAAESKARVATRVKRTPAKK